MDPDKQKKREKRLTKKEKSLKRTKERDRRDNHVQGMFSQASHEKSQEEKESEPAVNTEEKKTNTSKKVIN